MYIKIFYVIFIKLITFSIQKNLIPAIFGHFYSPPSTITGYQNSMKSNLLYYYNYYRQIYPTIQRSLLNKISFVEKLPENNHHPLRCRLLVVMVVAVSLKLLPVNSEVLSDPVVLNLSLSVNGMSFVVFFFLGYQKIYRSANKDDKRSSLTLTDSSACGK